MNNSHLESHKELGNCSSICITFHYLLLYQKYILGGTPFLKEITLKRHSVFIW